MGRFFLAAVFFVFFCGPAFGQILNGSFETGTDFGSNNFIRVYPGGSDIADWTVASGNVDYLGPFVVVCNGVRTVDMNGNTPGAISQTFVTAPGMEYRVTFCMAGNPNGPPAVKTLDVSVTGGSTRSYQFDSTGFTLSNMGWTQKTYDFAATGPSTTITFTSTTLNSAYGPVLDDVILASIETWSGKFSFSLKITSKETDHSGNQKFLTFNQPFAGTMSLYVGENGMTTNSKGCYLEFLGDDGKSICIQDIAGISTESQKSKSEKALLVGAGTFTTTIEGTPVTGNAYLDVKATLKQDSSNNLIVMGLSGKVGGGVDSDFVFSGTLNHTSLTKQAGTSF